MNLSLDILRAVTRGAEHVEEEKGAFCFYRFSDEEMQTNANPNRTYAAGVSLCFRTDAKPHDFHGTCRPIEEVVAYESF